MPQKSLIWCWIPSTKSLIATGGSLDPFKASDEIKESHSKIISCTPTSYAKLTLVSIALALHSKGPRGQGIFMLIAAITQLLLSLTFAPTLDEWVAVNVALGNCT